jgi:hypothetical protein
MVVYKGYGETRADILGIIASGRLASLAVPGRARPAFESAQHALRLRPGAALPELAMIST